MSSSYDVIIIGAGAAGMMCAIEAGKRGRRVWLIDHAAKLGEKIRISGGGRCNFTNIDAGPDNYLSQNPHFCKSALSRFTPQDFISLLRKHSIPFHEKKLGQLFCDESAKDILEMLKKECRNAQVDLALDTHVETIDYADGGYAVKTSRGLRTCAALVIASGGLSIPKIGASKFGYEVARQFGLKVVETRAGLVPLTFQSDFLERCKALSGLSVEATVSCGPVTFSEGLLFTHRGLSGPSILQISSYWREGQEIIINLAPGVDALDFLKDKKRAHPKQDIQTALSDLVPKRLAQSICDDMDIKGRLADLPDKTLSRLAAALNDWHVKPGGTEGYRTAEVTLGGVDTGGLSSQTMEAKKQPGLYFIGEVVDVTGQLGGYNFQWAWASGYAAGQAV
ncbi:MAG: NAD(P)/FAD-dependent oxidoreductase [Rhodospirillales bacterium]|nr:NAD(P)/FAD-dependent oxidoreductase [Rhodospirillales bacterium]